MSTLSANLGAELSIERVGKWKRRALAILLMAGIASFFWVDSRYPSLVKKYHAGTQIKVAGTLSFDKITRWTGQCRSRRGCGRPA